jgi:acyl dehydratase
MSRTTNDASPSQLRALGRYLIADLRERRKREDDVGSGRSRASVEAAGREATPKLIRHFLEATDGVTIPRLAGGDLVPPTLPGIWATSLLLDLLRLGRIPFPRRGVVHLGSETTFLRLPAANAPTRVKLQLRDRVRTERGVVVIVGCQVREGAGRLCSEGEKRFLLPGVELDCPSADPPPAGDPHGASGWSEVARWRLRARHARRFARASGDFNPVHLGALPARLFGYARPLLHGACSEAMIAHALVRARLQGDPAALRKLEITFSAPLQLPSEARLLVSQVPEQQGWGFFRLVGPDLARTPYAHGTWVGAADPGAGNHP